MLRQHLGFSRNVWNADVEIVQIPDVLQGFIKSMTLDENPMLRAWFLFHFVPLSTIFPFELGAEKQNRAENRSCSVLFMKRKITYSRQCGVGGAARSIITAMMSVAPLLRSVLTF